MTVAMPGRPVRLRVWRIAVGRADLYLLDARDSANRPEDSDLTAQLYGGDNRTRIQQEMLLGVGGYRALAAIGVRPSVLHLNEGHSAFALFERARQLIAEPGDGREPRRCARWGRPACSPPTRRWKPATTASTSTWSPSTWSRWPQGMGLSVEELIDLGPRERRRPLPPHRPRPAGGRSGSTASPRSTAGWPAGCGTRLYPGRAEHEVPIGHVTNGVHAPTWLAGDMQELIAHYLGPNWLDSLTRRTMWAGVEPIPDAELWEVHQVLKSRLIAFVRGRLDERRRRLGLPEPAARGAGPAAR